MIQCSECFPDRREEQDDGRDAEQPSLHLHEWPRKICRVVEGREGQHTSADAAVWRKPKEGR